MRENCNASGFNDMPNGESSGATNRIAAYILFVAIAGAPFLFGSRDPLTVAFWCGLLALGLLVASVRQLRAGHVAIIVGVALIALCYGFVLHEQLADRPWIAPFNPVWAQASELLGKAVPPSVSIVRGEPFYAVGPALAATLALLLGLVVGSDRTRANQTLEIAAWAGAAYGAYGIFALLVEPTAVLWREKVFYVGSLTATFINRNTAATYFGSSAAVCLVLLLWRVRTQLPKGRIAWRKVPEHILLESGTDRQIIVRFLLLFACVAALFLTSSRAGVLISLAVLTGEFFLFFRRDLRGARTIISLVAFVAVAALVILQLGGGVVSGRIESSGLSDQGRLSAYRAVLRLIADNPWFGTGWGTFAWAFPPYRGDDVSMMGVWDIAHSTPLEIAAELGIPLCLLVISAWIVAFVILIRGAIRRRRDAVVPIAALSVSLIGVAHSMVDFSLQIPGYMIVAFAVLGVGLSQSLVPPLAVEREGATSSEAGVEEPDEEAPEERHRRRR